MFDSLRDRFHTVQEGISASFRGLSTSDSVHKHIPVGGRKVNYNAGGELLLKYQNEWSELHKLSEENAVQAQVVDDLITKLHTECQKSWTSMNAAAMVLASVPQILADVQGLMTQLGTLTETFEEVETGLARLEDIVEVQELQEQQLDHRFQLALYKERRLAELEAVRDKLAAEHAQRIREHEARQEVALRERQETFEQAFKEDLQQYKESGTLPGTISPPGQKTTSLEEVILEPEDPAALDSFLEDDTKETETPVLDSSSGDDLKASDVKL